MGLWRESKRRIGLGHTIQIHSPVVNKNLFGIVAGGNYSVFLDNAENIFTCGSNEDGQGLGSNVKPRLVLCNICVRKTHIVREATSCNAGSN